MKFANLTVNGRLRAAMEVEAGYALLPDGMPESVDEIIAGGEEMLSVLSALDPKWLEIVSPKKAQFAPAVAAGRKLLMVGVNYGLHATECGQECMPHPVIFGKFSNALAASGDTVYPPLWCEELDFEAELVVLVGKTCKNVSPEEAEEYIFGYTVGNDLSARDLQFRTSQWCQGKSCDGFAPVGPTVVTRDEVDVKNLPIRCKVNGEVRQDSNTSDMLRDAVTLVSYLSSVMTLEAGDAIFTGTPAGVALGEPEGCRRYLKAGDVVEVSIAGVSTCVTVVGEKR